MRKSLAVKNLYDGLHHFTHQEIIIEEGVVQLVQPLKGEGEDQYDFENLAPGMNDIHINGGNYHHFTRNPAVETVADIALASKKTGTAYTLPTLITSSTETILAGLEATRSFMEQHPDGGVLGMHLEGPFISLTKRGAHLSKYIRKPSKEELKEILSVGEGVLKMITVAPEVVDPALMEILLDANVRVSAGHSNATYQQAVEFFNKGGDLITHFYNAMSGFNHREPGLVGAILESNQVHVPIILDGVHCDFGAARVAYKAVRDQLFLISDALFLGGYVETFKWEEFDAKLETGRYTNSEGNLAGGAISMGDAVRNAVNEVRIPLNEAISMATYRPARALHLENKIGRVAPGFPAVFTTFDQELAHFEVHRY